MIELRYIYLDISDNPILQYRTWNIFTATGIRLPLTEDQIRWSEWKSIKGVIVSESSEI